MNLLEFNELIKAADTPCKFYQIEDSVLKTYLDIRKTICKSGDVIDSIEDSAEFAECYSDIKQIVNVIKDNSKGYTFDDVFYAGKLGYYTEYIPPKLEYIIRKAMSVNSDKNYLFMNKFLNSCYKSISKFAKYTYNGKQLDAVITSLTGISGKLLTNGIHYVYAGSTYELYVENVDTVALLPRDIGAALTEDIAKTAKFDVEHGILVQDIPVRIMCDRIGITLDDFDLRSVV